MQEIISKKNIGERLKTLRYNKKLSQAEVSEALGLSRSHYSQVELGKQFPSYTVLSKIAEYYGKSYDWILHGQDPANSSVEDFDSAVDNHQMDKGMASDILSLTAGQLIPLVNSEDLLMYLKERNNEHFIDSLPKMALPLPKLVNSIYRAFKIEGDNPELMLFDQDVVVGEMVKDKLRIVIGRPYIVIKAHSMQVVKFVDYLESGAFLYIKDSVGVVEEVQVDSILELWDIKLKITFKLNGFINSASHTSMERTVAALADELAKLKSSGK